MRQAPQWHVVKGALDTPAMNWQHAVVMGAATWATWMRSAEVSVKAGRCSSERLDRCLMSILLWRRDNSTDFVFETERVWNGGVLTTAVGRVMQTRSLVPERLLRRSWHRRVGQLRLTLVPRVAIVGGRNKARVESKPALCPPIV